MTDFGTLITSLGECAVEFIGEDNLKQLAVIGHELTLSASVEIALSTNDWAHQVAAIDKMIELRGVFFDDLALDYEFVAPDDLTYAAAQERTDASSRTESGYVYA